MLEGRDLVIRSRGQRYAFAVSTVACAMLLNLGWLQFDADPPVAPFLAAILLTGWYAGRGPVAMATILSGLVYLSLFAPPYAGSGWDAAPRLIWFALFALGTGWFSTARRSTANALQRERDQLEDRVAERTAELRRSEQYLLAAQRLSHTGSWALEVSTGKVTWSEECTRILGRGVVDSVPPRLAEFSHPDDLPVAQELLTGAVRGGASFETQFRIIRPDGEIRHVRSAGRPVFDAHGVVVEYVGIVVDVTDRKLAARKLRHARERATEARFAAILDERARLARDMHDTLLQGFTGVGLNLVAVTNRMAGPPEIVGALREVIASAQSTLENARRAIWGMRPSLPSGQDFMAGLREAAEDAVRGTGLSLSFHAEGPGRPMEPDVEAAVYRVMQEAVANAVQHASAHHVRVSLTYERKQVRLRVADDGTGFVVDPNFHAYSGHLGLLGMQERANQVRGTFSVRSSTASGGTEVEMIVPLAKRNRRLTLMKASGNLH